MKKPLLFFFVFATISARAQLEKSAKPVGLQSNLILGDIYATNFALDIGRNKKWKLFGMASSELPVRK